MTASHDRNDLWGALALDAAQPPVVAIVGGGGKTSLLYRLGREAEARGLRAVLGGTTRFTRDPAGPMPPIIVEREAALAERVSEALERAAVVVAATSREPQHRLASLPDAVASALARIDGLGLLALEADGSKMRPFKAPADHEPVIPSAATHVVAVVGADAIDAPLDEAHVHRPERVCAPCWAAKAVRRPPVPSTRSHACWPARRGAANTPADGTSRCSSTRPIATRTAHSGWPKRCGAPASPASSLPRCATRRSPCAPCSGDDVISVGTHV